MAPTSKRWRGWGCCCCFCVLLGFIFVLCFLPAEGEEGEERGGGDGEDGGREEEGGVGSCGSSF